jgi:hypothetical protein
MCSRASPTPRERERVAGTKAVNGYRNMDGGDLGFQTTERFDWCLPRPWVPPYWRRVLRRSVAIPSCSVLLPVPLIFNTTRPAAWRCKGGRDVNLTRPAALDGGPSSWRMVRELTYFKLLTAM